MGHFVGTPLYMAPESVLSANVTPRSDVYAVGAVAYALLTGRSVFAGNSGAEIVGHHIHTRPVPPSERLGREVSPMLERLVLDCLAKKPQDRPADAGAVLQQLEEGWTGARWTQRDARLWWETQASAMLAARRAAEESVSRGPKLAVDVSSRMRTSQSLPELSLDGETRDRGEAGGFASAGERQGEDMKDGAKRNGKGDGRGDGKEPLKGKTYDKELRRLQAELCHLQEWLKVKGERVIVVFEGRDAAGKGGTIKAITERVSPRVFRLVALPAPSDREKTQMYLQRYIPHFPAAGEIVIFDRSWYNRAGVEHVLGFCTKEQHRRFLEVCPLFEKQIVDSGIRLLKYWLEVSPGEQKRRFQARIEDPLRQWKLSPTDLESRRRWYDYSRARDQMLDATDTKHAPWHIVRSDDKNRARLNCITHLLGHIPYKRVKREKIGVVGRSRKRAYDDEAPMKKRRWIPEAY